MMIPRKKKDEISTLGIIIITITSVSFVFLIFLGIGTLCKNRKAKKRKDTFMIDKYTDKTNMTNVRIFCFLT